MSFDDLKKSIGRDDAPASGWSLAVQSLWHDARGDWEAAHGCAQEDSSREGSWVHAYLHRKEGDLGNAGYWYARAGRKAPSRDLTPEAEWSEIAQALAGT